MAQVPVYGGTQVRSSALQPVQQQQIDVSSGMRAAGAALGQVADLADKVVQRDAQDEAFKLERQIRDDWQQHRAKLRENYKGDQAEQYGAAAAEWWKEAPGKYAATASPMARRLATRSLSTLQLQADADTLGYVEGEKKRSRDINFQTAQNSKARDYANSITPTNALAVGRTAAEDITAAAIAYAAGEGLNSDVGKSIAQKQLDAFHANTALALADKDAKAARAYLGEFGAAMPADVRLRVTEGVDKAFNDQEGRRLAASNAVLPYKEQLAAGAKIDDPELRRAYEYHVDLNVGRVNKAREQEQNAARDEVYQLFEQRKPIPADLLARMGGPERSQFENLKRERARQAATGTPVKTDFATWYDLSNRIARGEKIDLRPYTGKISEGDLQQLTVKQQGAASPAKQDALFTTAQRVEKILPGLGIDPKKDPESAYKIGTEVDRRIRVMSTAKGGKDLLPDEVQKIVDDVALDKVYVDEFGRDPEKPIALLTPEELGKAYVRVGGKEVRVSSVPMADRQQIIAALKATGRAATEQAVVELYLRAKNPRISSGAVK